jgi:hypothetical protein
LKLRDVDNILASFKSKINKKPPEKLTVSRLHSATGTAILICTRCFRNIFGPASSWASALRKRTIRATLKAFDFTQLDRFFEGRVENYTHHDPGFGKSLVSFAYQVLFGDHTSLSNAVSNFKLALQPVIIIDKHPDMQTPSRVPFDDLDLTDRLNILFQSCTRKTGQPEYLVLRLVPGIAKSFDNSVKVKKSLDLGTLIFTINGYDMLPRSVVMGAWFNRDQVTTAIRRIQYLRNFREWGDELESKTDYAMNLLGHSFPARKINETGEDSWMLDEAIVIFPFYMDDIGVVTVADHRTSNGTPQTCSLHIFCDVREKDPVAKFPKPLWARRLDIDIKLS